MNASSLFSGARSVSIPLVEGDPLATDGSNVGCPQEEGDFSAELASLIPADPELNEASHEGTSQAGLQPKAADTVVFSTKGGEAKPTQTTDTKSADASVEVVDPQEDESQAAEACPKVARALQLKETATSRPANPKVAYINQKLSRNTIALNGDQEEAEGITLDGSKKSTPKDSALTGSTEALVVQQLFPAHLMITNPPAPTVTPTQLKEGKTSEDSQAGGAVPSGGSANTVAASTSGAFAASAAAVTPNSGTASSSTTELQNADATATKPGATRSGQTVVGRNAGLAEKSLLDGKEVTNQSDVTKGVVPGSFRLPVGFTPVEPELVDVSQNPELAEAVAQMTSEAGGAVGEAKAPKTSPRVTVPSLVKPNQVLDEESAEEATGTPHSESRPQVGSRLSLAMQRPDFMGMNRPYGEVAKTESTATPQSSNSKSTISPLKALEGATYLIATDIERPIPGRNIPVANDQSADSTASTDSSDEANTPLTFISSAKSLENYAKPLTKPGLDGEQVAMGTAGTAAAKTELAMSARRTIDWDKATVPSVSRLMPKSTDTLSVAGEAALSGQLQVSAADLAKPLDTNFTKVEAAPAPVRSEVKPVDLEKLQSSLLKEVRFFKQTGAESMRMVIEPTPDTRLAVHLQMTDGRMVAEMRCEQGDAAFFQSHWSELQNAMAAKGVDLGDWSNQNRGSEHKAQNEAAMNFAGEGSTSDDRRREEPIPFFEDTYIPENVRAARFATKSVQEEKAVESWPRAVIHKLESWA